MVAPNSGSACARRPWTKLVLLSASALLAAMAFVYVASFCTNCPFADEWEFVPALTGHAAFGPWLWDQHNEHRLPLPRAVYFGLFCATHDFRTGSFLQVAVLSALSFWLMAVAARLRGRPSLTDLFFPLTLLHLGHGENWLMGYQLCFVEYTALTAGLLVVALRTTPATAFPSGVAGGVLAALLALCGNFGLIVSLSAAVWVVGLSVLVRRSSRHGRGGRALLVLALGLFPAGYAALHARGYSQPPQLPVPDLTGAGLGTLTVTAQALSVSLGEGVRDVWYLAAAVVLVVTGSTAVVLVRRLGRSEDRPAAAGVLAVAVGVVGVAAAIGVSRTVFGGLAPRYSLLTWPLLAAAYFSWIKWGAARGRWVQAVLCLAALGLYPQSSWLGLMRGVTVAASQARVEKCVDEGLTAEEIAEGEFDGISRERARRGIPLLHDAGVGFFTRCRN